MLGLPASTEGDCCGGCIESHEERTHYSGYRRLISLAWEFNGCIKSIENNGISRDEQELLLQAKPPC